MRFNEQLAKHMTRGPMQPHRLKAGPAGHNKFLLQQSLNKIRWSVWSYRKLGNRYSGSCGL